VKRALLLYGIAAVAFALGYIVCGTLAEGRRQADELLDEYESGWRRLDEDAE